MFKLLLIAAIATSSLWGLVLGKSMAETASPFWAMLFGVNGFIMFFLMCIIAFKINDHGKTPTQIFLIISTYVALALPAILRMFCD